MRAHVAVRLLGGCLIGLAIPLIAAENTVSTQFKRSGGQGEVQIHSRLALPVSAMAGRYTVLRSTDLQSWEPVGSVQGGAGVSDEVLRLAVPLAGDHAFYRVEASVGLAPAGDPLGSAIYGYGTEFQRQLQAIGQIPLNAFADAYAPAVPYLERLSFEPTAAEYWQSFEANNQFRLNPTELSIFQTNGFVVSQRLGSHSCADLFYRVFTADLPVYVSCDAILHAWHRSYITMLEEVEETALFRQLDLLLQLLNAQVPALAQQAAGTAVADGVRDADYLIAVARSLLTGTSQAGNLGQGAQVQATLTAINNLQPAEITLFGTNRLIDFSQFAVRGHYETSPRLGCYFRAMKWCGLVDFQFTGSATDNSLRELSGAVAMSLLLQNSGQIGTWQQMEDVIQLFAGAPDATTFGQLGALRSAAGIFSPAQLPDRAALQALQDRIMSGTLGVQNIQGGYFWSPLGPGEIKLPRSFAVIPSRFTLDGWCTSQCVFDRILWDEDGIPGLEDKVMRRVPSALDVAFSVFGNDQVTALILDRIGNPAGHPWRDGYPYQHNLAAVRAVVDTQKPGAWTNSIYSHWLACLRELSAPTSVPEYPETLRTRAWAMKTLNTQLASWTQLRHDTVLYAKQAYTGNILCSYPRGFVEPRGTFWERMRDMAQSAAGMLSALPQSTQKFVFESYTGPATNTFYAMHTNRMGHLANFAARMDTLAAISRKELSRQPLSAEEDLFLQSVIENPLGYMGEKTYSGWYPSLFFLNTRAQYSTGFSTCDHWDALVTDVHTDPADPIVGDPGCVLHEAVGNVGLLVGAIQWGPGDSCVYAGPVMSHYEFELGPTTRKTDGEWKADLRAGRIPPQPEWTRDFLVPGNISYLFLAPPP